MPKRTNIEGSEGRVAVTTSLLLAGLLLLVVCAVQWSGSVQANTCVGGPPVKISGALCGRTLDIAAEVEPNVDLQVVDDNGSIIGQAHSNSKGDFKFAPLPQGLYRLTTTTPGWKNIVGQIEIEGVNQSSCRRPTTVVLGIQSCEGGIGNDRLRHFDEPGW